MLEKKKEIGLKSVGVPELMVIGTFFSLVFLFLIPDLSRSVALFADRPFSLHQAFGFLAYPFVVQSVTYWSGSALLLLAAGRLIGNETPFGTQAAILFGGWGLGGGFFLLFAEPGQGIAGPGVVTRAFLGAAVVYGLFHWGELRTIGKAGVVLFAAVILLDAFLPSGPKLPYLLSACAGCFVMVQWLGRNGSGALESPD